MNKAERKIKKELKECFKLRNIEIERVYKNKIEFTRIKIDAYSLDVMTSYLDFCYDEPSFYMFDNILSSIKKAYILWLQENDI